MSEPVTVEPRSGGRPSGIESSRSGAALALSRYTQQAGLVAVVVVLGIVFASINSAFASPDNLIDLFRAVTLYFIVACATTLVLVGGGLDFSIGAVYALGAVVAGLLMTSGVPWPVAMLGGIGVGVLAGAINAAVSVYLHVPPLIATLGMFFVAGGIAVVITGGVDVYGFSDDFINIGAGALGGIPYLIFYAIGIGILFHVVLETTVFGYNIRAIGGNRAAAAPTGSASPAWTSRSTPSAVVSPPWPASWEPPG